MNHDYEISIWTEGNQIKATIYADGNSLGSYWTTNNAKYDPNAFKAFLIDIVDKIYWKET